MSNLATIGQAHELSPDQVALVKNTIAKNATDDELKLFFHRCKAMGLDPLKPGQIHFIKYGSNPGTIVIGIDGFRSLAAKTGKHVGTNRGVIRDEKGKCVGAWCEVSRSDWSHPAREEVSMAEYNTGKAQWLKMPETMIKKVAEVAALRMAFPDELGGIYSDEEMAQAENDIRPVGAEKAKALKEAVIDEEHEPLFPEEGLGSTIIQVGKKYKGLRFDQVGVPELKSYVKYFTNESALQNKPLSNEVQEFVNLANEYFQQIGAV